MLYTRKGDSGTTKLLFVCVACCVVFVLFFAARIQNKSTPLVVNTNPRVEHSVPVHPQSGIVSNVINSTKISASSVFETIAEKKVTTISCTIVVKDQTVALSVPTQTTLYDALLSAQKMGEIIFSGKQFPSLGFFVTDIGTLHAGEGKNLIYYINGKEATVGITSYVLHDGDAIVWKLE